MNQLLKKGIAVVALFVVVGLGYAYAQEGLSVKIQPAIVEDRVDPGKTFSSSLRVSNLSSDPVNYYLVVRDVLGVGENGQPLFTEEKSDAYGLSDWVFLSKTQVSLRAGETIEVPFEVRVPQGAIPGGHFGGIFVTTRPESQNIIGSSVGAEVGTIVSLRVTGEVIEEARIREFHSDKSIYSKPEINFTIRIENLGNVLIRPRGTIEIDNMLGRRVAQLDVNKESVRIFPRSERSFVSGWVSEGLAFGRYQALISVVYGEDQKKTISHAVSFWILPLKEIGIAFLAIVIFIGGFYFWSRWYVRRKIQELQGGASSSQPRKESPPSRLLFLTLGVAMFTFAFLAILFLLFS